MEKLELAVERKMQSTTIYSLLSFLTLVIPFLETSRKIPNYSRRSDLEQTITIFLNLGTIITKIKLDLFLIALVSPVNEFKASVFPIFF